MNRKKLVIGLVIVVGIAAVIYANLNTNRTTGIEVTTEKIARHDLQAIVSASGKIRAQRTVNVSAETSGKVVGLAVNEGDSVTAGQFLLQIDPRNLQTQVNSREASLAAARSQLIETERSIESARTNLKQAEDNAVRQRELFRSALIPRETLDRAESDLKLRQTELAQREQSLKTQQTRIKQDEAALENANFDLNKVRIVSPITGIVTRRNIEEGETAVVGTMNNAGTVLLTIADLSVIETEVEVDETDIPFVTVGQPAEITIDAFPDRKFPGKVTEVGNSAIQTTGAATTRATNFKVVVTLEGEVPNVRPGFTCTAVITTATRQKAVAVPIQATAVREMVVNADGSLVREPAPAPGHTAPRRPTTQAELQPGQTRKEIEGAFLVKDGRAVFTPIKVGIAGEKFFEVLEGLNEGDEVITGPFSSVRTLRDGDQIKISTGSSTAAGSTAGR